MRSAHCIAFCNFVDLTVTAVGCAARRPLGAGAVVDLESIARALRLPQPEFGAT